MPTIKKEQTINGLEEKVKNSKIMVLTDYRGLSVSELNQLRSELSKNEIDYTITKNTLIRIAAKNFGLEGFESESVFAGPTAIAFAYNDEVTPAKILKEFAAKLEKLHIKGAIYNNTFLTKDKVEELASLPSKETLLGKLVGMLNSPLYGLLNIAQAKQRELLYALKAIASNKK